MYSQIPFIALAQKCDRYSCRGWLQTRHQIPKCEERGQHVYLKGVYCPMLFPATLTHFSQHSLLFFNEI